MHRGVHYLSAKATTAYEDARAKVGRFINACSDREVVFTRNASEAINLVAQTWGMEHLKQGDEVRGEGVCWGEGGSIRGQQGDGSGGSQRGEGAREWQGGKEGVSVGSKEVFLGGGGTKGGMRVAGGNKEGVSCGASNQEGVWWFGVWVYGCVVTSQADAPRPSNTPSPPVEPTLLASHLPLCLACLCRTCVWWFIT